MRIALDFDGTLAATDELILALMNWRFGTKYKREDWDDWDFWRKMGPEYDEAFWGVFDLMDETYLRRAIPPTDPFAPAVVKWLMKRGHTVHLVTANSEKAVEAFNGWMWAQGIEMPIVALGRGSGKDKADLDYNLFIDDSPKLAESIHRHPRKKLILYRRPLNAYFWANPTQNVWPANDWLEIKRILEAMGA